MGVGGGRVPRDAGPVGEPVNAAGRSPPGMPWEMAPHFVPTGNPVAPSASHVASRATNDLVEQLDLFALLAPRIATLGASPSRPRVEAALQRKAVPAWPFADALQLAVEAARKRTEAGALTASVFDAYRPSVRVPGACPHPTRLVESAAMAAATAPPCDYRPVLPEHLVTEGHLSGRPTGDRLPGWRSPRGAPSGYQRGGWAAPGVLLG